MKYCFLFLWISLSGQKVFAQLTSAKPNILFIVADDLGYADLGCFGGIIETPNIDKLAKEGIRFSRYHSAPLCAVARSMFLTGNDNHIAGMGVQGLQTGIAGYEGCLSDRVVTVPDLLKDAGYHTVMAGKWHLGKAPQSNPHQKGFLQSFVVLDGAANHYNSLGVLGNVHKSEYTENGKLATWPDGAYSTDFYTDKLISYMEKGRQEGKPFFAFAAFTSPHWPLQVDEKFWKKYTGKFDDGYEAWKKRNMQSLQKAGMIAADFVAPPNHERVKPWDSLTKEQQKWNARAMELYAGMVDNLDYNVGRLVQYLKSTNAYDNTLIVLVSDNGAAAEDFFNNETQRDFIRQNYTEAYDSMGKVNSYISYGPQWAEAGSAPFRYFKSYATEGGMVAPMIISGPMVEAKGSISPVFTTLVDLAPTFYSIAEVSYPAIYRGKSVYPLRGKPITPVFHNPLQAIHGDDYVFAFETNGNACVRKGNWKLVNFIRPFDERNFQLFNLMDDPGEQVDLKQKSPEKYRELLADWQQYVKEAMVSIPAPKQGEGL